MKTEQDFTRQAKELVSQMTLEERAAMMRYDSPAIPRLGIPSYNWWNEALHGVARAGRATVFPQAIAMAAAFDRETVRQMGRIIAEEGRAKYNDNIAQGDREIYKGLTFWSPNVNIFRDPRWGRGHETYGEDPYLAAELGKAFVETLQEKDENGYMKAAACAKHFAVHSGPETLRHEFNAEVSQKDLWETYLYAFEELVTQAKTEGVMGAYNRVYGEPCCGSHLLLKEILRDIWQFDGYVVSDCGAINDFHEHHKVTHSKLESVALAVENGCDLNCGGSYPYIIAAYDRGLLTEEQITRCAERVMRTRLRLGLFDESCRYNTIRYDKVCCPEHIQSAIDAARKSMVLLKNDGTLPLRDIRTLAVIGPNADNRVALLGNYHGTPDRYITPLDAMYNMADEKGIQLLYSEGCALMRPKVEGCAKENDRLSEAVSFARRSDAVVLFLGLDETIEGEEGENPMGGDYPAGDRNSLSLLPWQQTLLEAVCETGKPVVLVNMTGSATDLCYAQKHCAAILQAWYPGARGGVAVADILFGNSSPSGKLPVTFYRHTEDLPPFTDYSMENRTYRYYTGEPLYPFGYGLSYADIRLTHAEVADGVVYADVENRSDFAADEVLQLYIKDEKSLFAPPHPVLCGFERISLAPGEKSRVSLTLSRHAFTVVNNEGKRIPGSSHYSLYCGFNQPDARSTALTGRAALKIDIR